MLKDLIALYKDQDKTKMSVLATSMQHCIGGSNQGN